MHIKNEKGVTLIEIMASIVIIAIILISFAQFFIQNSINANYNNEKLVVTNLADAALVKLQNTTFTKHPDHVESEKNNTAYNLQQYFIDKTNPLPSPENQNPPTAIPLNGELYTVTYKAIQNKSKQSSVGLSEQDLNLMNVVVTVSSPDGKVKSSTEGYVYLE